MVATEPSAEVVTSSGGITISEKGIIFWVGTPFSMVLNWKTTGIFMSSLEAKKMSHLVRKIPVSSSTRKDCASGSYHPIISSFLDEATFWAPTTCVPRSRLTFLSWNSCLRSTLAFLIERIFSWIVSRVPADVNASSAIVLQRSWLLSGSLIRVKLLVPVSNSGKVVEFGSGMKKLPVKLAARSDTNLTSLIVACAPLDPPVRTIPGATNPKNSPWASADNENVSTFKISDVDEYEPESGVLLYGFSAKVAVGTSYGPSLWFDWAVLNVILASVFPVFWSNPVLFILPVTVSPTVNDPEIILISRSFGTQNLVTSSPSKNAYILVKGFILLETNSIFLDLMNGIMSLLTILSPTDSLSNCSVTIVLVPFLDMTPVSTVVWSVSSITLVSVASIRRAGLPKPPLKLLIQPPIPKVEVDDVSLLRVVFVTIVPVQLVSHAFQTIGAIPVCLSTFSVLANNSRVEAKSPSTSMTFAFNLAVSTQVSDAGVSSIEPFQKLIKNGVTLSVLVANDCFNHSTSA